MADSAFVDYQPTAVFISFHEANNAYTQCSVVNFLAVIKYIHCPFNAFTTKEIFQEIQFNVPKKSEGSRRRGFIFSGL